MPNVPFGQRGQRHGTNSVEEGGENMIAVVCVDDKGGVCFHNRRQSQDRVLREYLLSRIGDAPLHLSAYSAKQFAEVPAERLQVSDNPLAACKQGEYCFVEGQALSAWAEQLEAVVVFRWNRAYPADTHLDLDLDGGHWTLADRQEFAGYSHEKITCDTYYPRG